MELLITYFSPVIFSSSALCPNIFLYTFILKTLESIAINDKRDITFVQFIILIAFLPNLYPSMDSCKRFECVDSPSLTCPCSV